LRAALAIMVWTGLVMLAVVAIVEVSTGQAVELVAGDYIRDTARGEVADIARRAAQDATPDDKSASSADLTIKDWVEGIQAVATTLAILAAGGWALYVFLLGRSNVGHVEVLIEPRRLLTAGPHRGAVVSVTVKNTGRTRVAKSVARIRAEPLDDQQLQLSMQTPNVMPAAVSRVAPLGTVLFSKHVTETEEAIDGLEPGQVTSEEVVMILGDARAARVQVVFIGRVRPFLRTRARSFSSRIILELAALEDLQKE
jgi:hypothetical protein